MREHEKEIASEEIGGSIPSRQEVCWSQRGGGGTGHPAESREMSRDKRGWERKRKRWRGR